MRNPDNPRSPDDEYARILAFVECEIEDKKKMNATRASRILIEICAEARMLQAREPSPAQEVTISPHLLWVLDDPQNFLRLVTIAQSENAIDPYEDPLLPDHPSAEEFMPLVDFSYEHMGDALPSALHVVCCPPCYQKMLQGMKIQQQITLHKRRILRDMTLDENSAEIDVVTIMQEINSQTAKLVATLATLLSTPVPELEDYRDNFAEAQAAIQRSSPEQAVELVKLCRERCEGSATHEDSPFSSKVTWALLSLDNFLVLLRQAKLPNTFAGTDRHCLDEDIQKLADFDAEHIDLFIQLGPHVMDCAECRAKIQRNAMSEDSVPHDVVADALPAINVTWPSLKNTPTSGGSN